MIAVFAGCILNNGTAVGLAGAAERTKEVNHTVKTLGLHSDKLYNVWLVGLRCRGKLWDYSIGTPDNP